MSDVNEKRSIFVNERQFELHQQEITGAEIAKLVDVHSHGAIVLLQIDDESRQIGSDELVRIADGMRFLVADKEPHDLHLFVNQQKFDRHTGVRHEMTGAQIAGLVSVPVEKAIVVLETEGEPQEVKLDDVVFVLNGMRFVVAHREQYHFHIFVNRRKFEKGDGVEHEMTGAQIAALVEVPEDNAVVRIESGDEAREIPVLEHLHIRNGMHFLVTRRTVEGGHEH